MTRRFKYITIFTTLLLCVAMIGFGVYAATSVSFSISSKVSFMPTDAYLQVLGYIDGVSPASGNRSYYAANYSTSGEVGTDAGNYTTDGGIDTFNTWNFGDIILDGTSGATAANKGIVKPEDMIIYLQVTNFSSRAINYTVALTGSSASDLTANDLSCTGEYYVEQNASTDVIYGTNGFYSINPSGAPSSAPVTYTGTNKGNITFGDVINASTDYATMMIKITISPTDDFDPRVDMSKLNFGFSLTALYAS